MKKKYVLDANILFGAFISGKNIYKVLFTQHEMYVPDFMFSKIEKYKELILKKAKVKEVFFKHYVVNLMNHIIVIPNFLITKTSFKKAYKLCKDIDEKDTAYVALTMELDIEFITNDKELFNGLRSKGFDKVILFNDFIKSLQSIDT